MCWALALNHLGYEDQSHHVEEISRLEHELSEASGNLKKSLVANTVYAERLARAEAEREIVEGRMAEVERQAANMASGVARLKKGMEEAANKNSVLGTEISELKAKKGAIEAELDRNFEETLELLNQSIF